MTLKCCVNVIVSALYPDFHYGLYRTPANPLQYFNSVSCDTRPLPGAHFEQVTFQRIGLPVARARIESHREANAKP